MLYISRIQGAVSLKYELSSVIGCAFARGYKASTGTSLFQRVKSSSRDLFSSSSISSMPLSKDSSYTLNNGCQIPITGFGVYETPPKVTENTVFEALKAGYKHIDSAKFYKNEKESAEAISRFIRGHPEVKREDIFFTSKIVNFKPVTYEEATSQIQQSLDLIKNTADYFDLFLIHCPYPDKASRLAQYQALQDFVEAGKIKSIGVSNYGVHHMDELLNWEGLKIKPVINQVELHPWLPRKDLQEHSEKHGYLLEAYSPLTRAKKLDDPVLKSIADKHGKTPAEILLRWSYDQGFIPLAKTITVARIKPNYEVLDHVVLDEGDKKALDMPDSYEVFAWDPTVHVDA